MKYTPLTSSGSQSRMAQLDVTVNFSGGAAPVDTISDKQVISVNQLFTTEEFNDGNTLENDVQMGKQDNDVNKLKKDYMEKVPKCNLMLVKASARALGLLAQCRKHGGPLLTDNAALLDTLIDEQVLLQ